MYISEDVQRGFGFDKDKPQYSCKTQESALNVSVKWSVLICKL